MSLSTRTYCTEYVSQATGQQPSKFRVVVRGVLTARCMRCEARVYVSGRAAKMAGRHNVSIVALWSWSLISALSIIVAIVIEESQTNSHVMLNLT